MPSWKAWCSRPARCYREPASTDGVERIGLADLLRECSLRHDPADLKQLHLLLVSEGLDTIAVWVDHLVRLFAASNDLRNACRVFSKVLNPSLYTWNAIVSAHVMLGCPDAAFLFYRSMLQTCLLPDRVMLLSLLKACEAPQAMLLHHHTVSYGFDSDPLVASALASVHAKTGSLREAYESFMRAKKRDAVSWGALMTGHIQHGYFVSVLKLFKAMLHEGVHPDRVIILCVLKACSHVREMKTGRWLHDELVRVGLDTNLSLGNTLIDMYGRSGSLDEAHRVLQRLPERDVVSWNALFAGYTAHGSDKLVFEYFWKMEKEGIQISKVTFLCVLKSCINVTALSHGWLIHELIIKGAYDLDLEIGNSLVDFYAKCGLPNDAYKIFCRLPKHDIVTWGSLVAGFAQAGNHATVLHLLIGMRNEGLIPNNIIFTSIFAACSRSGQIREGQKYFEEMVIAHKIAPSVENYSCLIDLFGRAGCLDQAQQFFESLPLQPDAVTWKSLLASCQTHGSVDLGQHCFGGVGCVDTEGKKWKR